MKSIDKHLLPIIVFSQFAGTSLWFAGNAIIGDIQKNSGSGFANITSIVQFGFIAGTLIFSLLGIADRFAAPKIFFISSVIAALSNLLLVFFATDGELLFIFRFITGFFLAGIYPVGMKIASDLFPEKTGKALGFLVGALVLGTAFPHLLKAQLHLFNWKAVLIFTSALALCGGLLVIAKIPRVLKIKIKNQASTNNAFSVFRTPGFRAAAFGYFGHMWELYALWAFVPLIIFLYNEINKTTLNTSLWSFLIIAAGLIGCIAGGLISQKKGSKIVAFISLLASGLCSLCSAFIFNLTETGFLFFLFFLGIDCCSRFTTILCAGCQVCSCRK